MIPEAAVEAAARAQYEHDVLTWDDGTEPDWECEGDSQQDNYRMGARAALEAAAPILLSHEREETRLAHLDAVVNAQTVDRLECELTQAKAAAWAEGHEDGFWNGRLSHGDPNALTGIEHAKASNPYRTAK